MSRTDKDRPFWVRANDSCESRTVYHNHDDGICNIGDARIPFYHYPRYFSYDSQRNYRDTHICEFLTAQESSSSNRVSPSALDRHLMFYGPQRAYIRAYTHDAIKVHRAGDLDDGYDIPSPQSRHVPYTGGGWW